MQLDINSIIKPLLTNYQHLFIPGLGTFTEKHIPSKEDTINGKLLPPDTLIVFEQGGNGDGSILLMEVKNKFSVDDHLASEAIKLFTRQIYNELDLHNSVEVPSLGRLYYNTDHQIAFVPSFKFFENATFGLPEIPFTAKTEIFTTPEVETRPIPLPPVPGNPILKFILLSLLVVALSVGGFFFVSTVYFKEKFKDIKEMVAAWNDKKLETEPIKNNTEVSNDTLSVVDDVPLKKDNKITETPIPQKKEAVESGEIVKIAIGIFGNPENAAKMVAKIEKAGYKSFSEKVGSLTKVGVEQKYSNMAEKLDILEKVRSDIEKTAVIIN
jgi:hypothetical protein